MKIYKINEWRSIFENEDLGDTENDNGFDDFEYKNQANHYMKEAIERVKAQVSSMFNNDEQESPTDISLEDVSITSMPMTERLFLKFSDTMYLYNMVVSIHLKEVVDNMSDDFDSDSIEFAGVRFKKYDQDSNLLGQLDKKKVKIDEINEDLFALLNQELDDKFNIDSGELDIEYES